VLEPYAVKVARTVLRGRGDSNVTLLPDATGEESPRWGDEAELVQG